MKPFTFEELQKILELKADEIDTDILIFNATLSYVEKLLDYPLEDRNYNEIQTVEDCMVFTEHEHITEMINIIDMTTKLRVPNCVIDGRRILFIDPKLEDHVVFLNYNAGFLPETFPADLKEAIVKLFLFKKREFLHQTNNEDIQLSEIPQDVQNIIYIYRRKSL
ncbi:MAG: hypothetical protein IJ688_05615 [Treponema sp.]|nr:hypothetical protein [Treponema sp.]